MAVYTGVQVHIHQGQVTASQDHTMVGTFASESAAILVALDSTNNPIKSADIEQTGQSTEYTFTVVTAK